MTTAQAPSANDFLLGGGSRKNRSMTFPTIGTVRTGVITEVPEVRQQNDPDTNQPKTWDNGDPVWQIVVTVATDERSPEIENDDGIRYFYIAGSKRPESLSMHVAVANAVRAAGVEGLEVGGRLTIKYIGDGPKSPNAPRVAKAPKQYSATYVSAANVALGVAGAPPTGPAVPAQQTAGPAPVAPAVDPALEAAYARLSNEQKAAAVAAGLGIDQINALFPAS